MSQKNDNVGKCGHAKCAGGIGCYKKGLPMANYKKDIIMSSKKHIKTADDARQFAIDWQHWQATQSLYMSELVDWQHCFLNLAEKFDLYVEFENNGII